MLNILGLNYPNLILKILVDHNISCGIVFSEFQIHILQAAFSKYLYVERRIWNLCILYKVVFWVTFFILGHSVLKNKSHAYNWFHEILFIFSASWWLKTTSIAKTSFLDLTSQYLNAYWISLIKFSPSSSNSTYVIKIDLHTYFTSFAWVSNLRGRYPSQSC